MGEVNKTSAGYELLVNGESIGVFKMMLDANCYGMVMLNNGLISHFNWRLG